MASMEQLCKDLAEGATMTFSTRRQRSSFVSPREAHRQHSNPAADRQQRTPVGGGQAKYHYQCNHSIPAAHTGSAVESMDEWWSNLRIDDAQQAVAGSVSDGHYIGTGEDWKWNLPTTIGGLTGNTTEAWLRSGHGGEHIGTCEARKRHLPTAASDLAEDTLDEWSTGSALSPCTKKQSWLHTEILNFCQAHELTSEDVNSRKVAQQFLESAVLELWPDAEVHLYGSSALGLALPTSDIDIVVVMSPSRTLPCGKPSPDAGPWVSELYNKLLKMQGVLKALTQLPHAKVPVLKGVFTTGLAFDISFDWKEYRKGQGMVIVRQFLSQYKALKPLCMVLKSFLREHDLNDTWSGGIGSFCLTIMTVNLLQSVGRSEGAGAAAASNDLGVLLVSFFIYYSNMHNYATDVVSVTPGRRHLSKQARRWINFSDPERLAVESPLDPTVDIGLASYDIHDIRLKFSRARRMLMCNWDEENLLHRMLKAG